MMPSCFTRKMQADREIGKLREQKVVDMIEFAKVRAELRRQTRLCELYFAAPKGTSA